MTEAEWLASKNPEPVLQFVEHNGSNRKLRLFSVACCRMMWHLLSDVRSRSAVELAERFADDFASEQERSDIHRTLDAETDYNPERDAVGLAFATATQAIQANSSWAAQATAAYTVLALTAHLNWSQASDAEQELKNVQAELLREIIGNPFRQTIFNPSWLTSTVLSLANGIYNDKAFDRMPILADALQDAGCDNEDVLNHCRQPGEHVRGCWVVDLLTGRK